MLERANQNSERLTDWESEDWKGVFPLAPKQEMMLMIDMVSLMSVMTRHKSEVTDGVNESLRTTGSYRKTTRKVSSTN